MLEEAAVIRRLTREEIATTLIQPFQKAEASYANEEAAVAMQVASYNEAIAKAEKNEPVAMCDLGKILIGGKGVLVDEGRGTDCLLQAAAVQNTDAMFALGELMYKKFHTDAVKAQGLDWYKKASALGHAEATRQLRRIELAQAEPASPASSGNQSTAVPAKPARRKCPVCLGTGIDEVINTAEGTAFEKITIGRHSGIYPCNRCQGKGYLPLN